jgi:hypothetical protein
MVVSRGGGIEHPAPLIHLLAQIRLALNSAGRNTITIVRWKCGLGYAGRYVPALAVVAITTDRFPVALASCYVPFEGFVHAGLPVAAGRPIKSQYFIRYTRSRLRLLGRSSRRAGMIHDDADLPVASVGVRAS